MQKEGATKAREVTGYPECKLPEGFLDNTGELSGHIIIEKVNPYQEFLKHLYSNQKNGKEEKKLVF